MAQWSIIRIIIYAQQFIYGEALQQHVAFVDEEKRFIRMNNGIAYKARPTAGKPYPQQY